MSDGRFVVLRFAVNSWGVRRRWGRGRGSVPSIASVIMVLLAVDGASRSRDGAVLGAIPVRIYWHRDVALRATMLSYMGLGTTVVTVCWGSAILGLLLPRLRVVMLVTSTNMDGLAGFGRLAVWDSVVAMFLPLGLRGLTLLLMELLRRRVMASTLATPAAGDAESVAAVRTFAFIAAVVVAVVVGPRVSLVVCVILGLPARVICGLVVSVVIHIAVAAAMVLRNPRGLMSSMLLVIPVAIAVHSVDLDLAIERRRGRDRMMRRGIGIRWRCVVATFVAAGVVALTVTSRGRKGQAMAVVLGLAGLAVYSWRDGIAVVGLARIVIAIAVGFRGRMVGRCEGDGLTRVVGGAAVIVEKGAGRRGRVSFAVVGEPAGGAHGAAGAPAMRAAVGVLVREVRMVAVVTRTAVAVRVLVGVVVAVIAMAMVIIIWIVANPVTVVTVVVTAAVGITAVVITTRAGGGAVSILTVALVAVTRENITAAATFAATVVILSSVKAMIALTSGNRWGRNRRTGHRWRRCHRYGHGWG